MPALEDFGYESFFESSRKTLGLDEFPVARVTTEHKGAYVVVNTQGEFLARVTGSHMFHATSREDYPAVGDWVAITELEFGQAVIHGILPRKTIIKRKFGDKNQAGEKTETQIIGTNIDVALIVESIDRDYNLNRFERYLAIAADGGARAAMILNKIDLVSKEELDYALTEINNRFKGIDVIPTSTLTEEGLEELKSYILPRQTYCFLGSSGVGKSTLINKLLGESVIKTDKISSSSGRGKHITTKREMYFLKNGGIVIDNPGMRELGIPDADSGINDSFDEITALGDKCKFINCTHTEEPGCQVLKALESGEIDGNQYANYIQLKKEAKYSEMSELEKRRKNRSFGQFLKNAKKELKKYKS